MTAVTGYHVASPFTAGGQGLTRGAVITFLRVVHAKAFELYIMRRFPLSR
jgi:hypothetical protein